MEWSDGFNYDSGSDLINRKCDYADEMDERVTRLFDDIVTQIKLQATARRSLWTDESQIHIRNGRISGMVEAYRTMTSDWSDSVWLDIADRVAGNDN